MVICDHCEQFLPKSTYYRHKADLESKNNIDVFDEELLTVNDYLPIICSGGELLEPQMEVESQMEAESYLESDKTRVIK